MIQVKDLDLNLVQGESIINFADLKKICEKKNNCTLSLERSRLRLGWM